MSSINSYQGIFYTGNIDQSRTPEELGFWSKFRSFGEGVVETSYVCSSIKEVIEKTTAVFASFQGASVVNIGVVLSSCWTFPSLFGLLTTGALIAFLASHCFLQNAPLEGTITQ